MDGRMTDSKATIVMTMVGLDSYRTCVLLVCVSNAHEFSVTPLTLNTVQTCFCLFVCVCVCRPVQRLLHVCMQGCVYKGCVSAYSSSRCLCDSTMVAGPQLSPGREDEVVGGACV